MTTDAFTTAASDRALSIAMETFKPGFDPENHPSVYRLLVDMAEWARDHLAAQEISHEEVIAAALELYARSHRSTGRQAPFESLDHEEQVSWVKDGRAVLSAARAVGRDAR